ncbi:acetylserotonin O-methyltransferase [Kitasatospora sp. NBC_00085]|uniref:methyltransferase n=1 Tax=unclassified Kitasatospora TaxID=2633591 RepID=UPI003252D04E
MTSQIPTQPATAAEYLPLAFGFALHQIGAAVSSLGILAAVAERPRTAEELIEVTGAHPRSLRRLLHAAVKAGLLALDGDGYRATAVAAHFGPLSDMHAAPPVWRAWEVLEESVRTGRSAFDIANGAPLFDHFKTDPKLAATFHAAMTGGSDVQSPAIVDHFDFSRFEHAVDVGGGRGTLLAAVLGANTGLRGTVFDTANGVVETAGVLAEAGLQSRCGITVGSFFESVPAGGDVYLLKNILHDWNDEESVRILGNIREVLPEGGRVVVFSSVLSEGGADEDPADALGAAISDIEMLVMTTGRERTLAEYRALFEAAGLELTAATPLPCPYQYHALEAAPAAS